MKKNDPHLCIHLFIYSFILLVKKPVYIYEVYSLAQTYYEAPNTMPPYFLSQPPFLFSTYFVPKYLLLCGALRFQVNLLQLWFKLMVNIFF